jgi:hypothetical protein
MTQYLVAIHHKDTFNAAVEETEATREAISALNREMVAAGIRVFVGGLKHFDTARSIMIDVNGEPVVTDGPYIEAKEHVGGFWVLECASMEDALEWGKKAAAACRAGVEVREFN